MHRKEKSWTLLWRSHDRYHYVWRTTLSPYCWIPKRWSHQPWSTIWQPIDTFELSILLSGSPISSRFRWNPRIIQRLVWKWTFSCTIRSKWTYIHGWRVTWGYGASWNAKVLKSRYTIWSSKNRFFISKDWRAHFSFQIVPFKNHALTLYILNNSLA